MRTLLVLWLMLVAMPSGGAAAEPVARVIDTSPGPATALAGDEPLYLRIAYDVDEAGWIEVGVLRSGASVSDRNGGIVAVAADRSEGLTWVSQPAGGAIDTVRLTIKNDKGRAVRTVDQPLVAQWTAASRSEKAGWVDPLMAATRQAGEAAGGGEPGGGGPGGVASLLTGLAMFAAGFLYLVLQVVLPRRWQGGWRIAALLPLVGLTIVGGWSLLALADGSNLWPLMLIFFLPVGFAYLVLVAGLKRAVGG